MGNNRESPLFYKEMRFEVPPVKKYNASTWMNRIWKDHLPVQVKSELAANLKRNWYFPISAGAFFCISARMELGYYLAMAIALLASLAVASQIPSMWAFTQGKPAEFRAVSFLTALGTCWAGYASFLEAWHLSPQTKALDAMLPIPMNAICVVGAVAAVFFVYFYGLLFWEKMAAILGDHDLLRGINLPERVVYGVLLAATVVFMALAFFSTDAFYGTAYEYDVIFTADSPALVKGNAYLNLTHLQNDIRQPLFSLFAAPFVGIPYLLGRVTGASAVVQAILMNSVQIGMLFCGNFMLTKMMGLDAGKRLCFLALSFCTYPYLLFSLMMEQYIVAYFWLVFCLYLICENRRPDRFALWGAGGTLLTSAILLPFLSDKHPIRNFRGWFLDMLQYGMEFVALMLVFCRFDVIFGLFKMITDLNTFAGHHLTLMDKFCQYTAFVSGCFVAPMAGENSTFVAEHISWQMMPVTGLHLTGLILLVLVFLSAVLNRKKRSSLFAIGWVGFSLVMLVGLGWGTAENGLILYTLYFGWAFFVLLFQLVEKIEEMVNIRWLVPAVTVLTCIALVAINIPAICDLLHFAAVHFPA